MTDSRSLVPGRIRQTYRKSGQHRQTALTTPWPGYDELRRQKSARLSRPERCGYFGPGEYADRNRVVANQRLTGE